MEETIEETILVPCTVEDIIDKLPTLSWHTVTTGTYTWGSIKTFLYDITLGCRGHIYNIQWYPSYGSGTAVIVRRNTDTKTYDRETVNYADIDRLIILIEDKLGISLRVQ